MIISNMNVGDWYEDDFVGGIVREGGILDVCVEKSLTDKDTDAHAIDIQNGAGYYDSSGHYRRYA